MGGFKDVFMDVVIDAQDAQNSIADQMLKDSASLHRAEYVGQDGVEGFSAASGEIGRRRLSDRWKTSKRFEELHQIPKDEEEGYV